MKKFWLGALMIGMLSGCGHVPGSSVEPVAADLTARLTQRNAQAYRLSLTKVTDVQVTSQADGNYHFDARLGVAD